MYSIAVILIAVFLIFLLGKALFDLVGEGAEFTLDGILFFLIPLALSFYVLIVTIKML